MSEDTRLLVYHIDNFHDQSAPEWYCEADQLMRDGLGWDDALSRVLGTMGQSFAAEPMGSAGIEISVWRSQRVGAYVEIGDCLALWDTVWVPISADWWPFQSRYLLPLVTVASNLAIAEELTRLGNVLIAFGRHGPGNHIDRYSGDSSIDLRREQALRSRQGSRK
jgi:hypothetical protein